MERRQTFDGHPWRGLVDVVSGGFPCQDISAAGKGAGIDGERSGLWREMARIIGEVGPRYVYVENSPMLTLRGLGTVLADLSALGFDAEWGVVSAESVGAPHRRERILIVGYAVGNGWESKRNDHNGHDGPIVGADGQHAIAMANPDIIAWHQGRADNAKEITGGRHADRGDIGQDEVCDTHRDSQSAMSVDAEMPELCRNVSDADSHQHQSQPHARRGSRQSEGIPQLSGDSHITRQEKWQSQPGNDGTQFSAIERADWWQSEPDVGRVAHGVAARVDRLKALGNGQVPQCTAQAWRILAK